MDLLGHYSVKHYVLTLTLRLTNIIPGKSENKKYQTAGCDASSSNRKDYNINTR